MTIGFATDVDVDLSLSSDDRPECLPCQVDRDTVQEAVIEGVINAPCGCPQYLCVTCHERASTWCTVGSPVWCVSCPKRIRENGVFTGWVKL